MIQYPCHHCKGLMYLDTVHEGHEVPCPHCDARFVVPVGAVSGRAASSGGAVDAEWSPSEPDGPSGLQVEAPTSRRSSSGPRVVRGEPMHPARRRAGGRSSRGRSKAVPSTASGARHRGPVPRTRGRGGPPPDDNGGPILVLGILGWVVCGLCAPIAWYMGNQAAERARRGGYSLSSAANIGRVLGMIQTILFLLMIGLVVVLGVAGSL